MQPKVAILLSTYNGEKYLKEQLESILKQTYTNIKILVRDDGSIDKTKEILKEYEAQDKIQIIEGENIGFSNSFFELLKVSPKADYYAFADQDDIWEENKIERAVQVLEKKKRSSYHPILYYSSYDFYNENMEFIKHPQKRNKISFENALFECVNAGMASLINEQARQRIVKYPQKQISLGHDWWAYLICATYGEVIYDDIAMVKHRMHQNNTSTQDYRQKKKRIESITNNQHFPKVRIQMQVFADYFYKDLQESQKKTINLFLKEPTIINQLKKLFYPKKIMNIWKEEIVLRIGFLLWII